MLEVLGFNIVPQVTTGNVVIIILVIGMVVAWWVRGWPERRRAMNESDQIKINEAELIRTDYAKQIKEFRVEVHSYRNELMTVRGELEQTRTVALRRGDKLNLVLFILRLVMSELRRLDPTSLILKQADALMAQVQIDDDEISTDALTAAKTAVAAAEKTVDKVREEKK